MYSQAGKPLPGGLSLASDRMASYGNYNSNTPMKTFAGQPDYAIKQDVVALAEMVIDCCGANKLGGAGARAANPQAPGFFFDPSAQNGQGACLPMPAIAHGGSMAQAIPHYQSQQQCMAANANVAAPYRPGF